MTASWTIYLDGSPISEAYEVKSIQIYNAVNRIPYARIVLRDGSAAKQTFAASESSDFLPGALLSIEAGYDQKESPVFTGQIVKQAIRLQRFGGSTLLIECRASCHKLSFSRKNAVFYDQTDAQIAQTILDTAGLIAGTLTDPAVTHAQMFQFNATDWDFLRTRAAANGLLLWVDADALSMAAPDLGATPELQYTFGTNVFEFEVGMDARDQAGTAEARTWDAATQALSEPATGAEPTVNAQGDLDGAALATAMDQATAQLQHSGALSPEELQAWADGRLYRSRLAKIRGRMTVQGEAGLKPGILIELLGFGARFNGTAFVSGVRHNLRNGDWMTEVTLGLAPEQPGVQAEASEPAAARLVPGARGLQIGKVLALAGDPAENFRVLVELPMLQDATKTGVWARMAHFHAGLEHGAFVLPEIDDEVLVGFLHDDPRQPVILGALYSTAQPPLYTPDDANPLKAFRTKAGLELAFDDEGVEFSLSTPAGNVLRFGETSKGLAITDENGNQMLLNDSGVEVQDFNGNVLAMNGDGLALTTEGDFSVTAAGNISLASDGDMIVDGKNVELAAAGTMAVSGNSEASLSSGSEAVTCGGGSAVLSGGNAEISGDATAKFSTSGTMTLEGNIININ
ncbi:MAG: type VI secretion system tip protein VgrG [Bacteroidota bacterium]